MSDQIKRRTMIKDRVACVRTSSYNLPQGPHVYGKKSPPDPEGAGEVISNWVTANPSASKESIRSYVHSNILSVKHGCVSAKAARQFAEEHEIIRMKEMLNETNGKGVSLYEGPFGIKTKFAEESIGSVIQAKFTDYSNDDIDYPTLSGLAKKGSLPPPRGTRASELLSSSRNITEESDKKPFKMKKFEKVPCRVEVFSKKNKTSRTIEDQEYSSQDEQTEEI